MDFDPIIKNKIKILCSIQKVHKCSLQPTIGISEWPRQANKHRITSPTQAPSRHYPSPSHSSLYRNITRWMDDAWTVDLFVPLPPQLIPLPQGAPQEKSSLVDSWHRRSRLHRDSDASTSWGHISAPSRPLVLVLGFLSFRCSLTFRSRYW